MDIGKNSIAFMCLVGSLLAEPEQPTIAELAESLKGHCGRKRADELMADKFTVSVIMPTYNRTVEIKESIRSVLNQTFADFELVIVNDGGLDGVKEIVDTFRSGKIKYFRLRHNKGLAGALNEGILRSEGKYIAYLDDDDVYYPDHLTNLVEFIERHHDYDYVYSNAWWCSGENKDGAFIEKSRKLLERRPQRFDSELLFDNNYISTLNILHKKESLRKTGLFNEDLPMLMDWEMWMRFALECKFYQLNNITGEYRFKENNMSTIDHLTIRFLANILRPYYETNCGQIVFLKHYLDNGERSKAEEIFHSMLPSYSRYPLTIKKRLYRVSRRYFHWKSKILLGAFATSYTKNKARRVFDRF